MAFNTTLKIDDIVRVPQLQGRVTHSDDHSSDIAETLEISIPALKSRLHRARLYVRQRLAEISQAPAQEEVSR